MEKKFFTTDEVRHEVFSDQISKGTILTMIREKEIPSIRMRKRFFIPAYWVNEQFRIAEGKEGLK
ncbi:hypothetical protein FX155_01290 [Acidaminococcus fermentans]|uniref:DNA-binding protein n=1 Tax=Acidaminococcus fermentans TaxID=905 RepID=A0A6N7VZ92_ACIFE|nr:hypothetical protein [Acidaminococcus fermentans]MDD6287134.1 hypothetical protein [Acidaminococcus fermentans]MSS81256.1 hypothetical protein [Acidaminococcus fermentans]